MFKRDPSTNVDSFQNPTVNAFSDTFRNDDEALIIGSIESIKSEFRRIWQVPMRIEGLGYVDDRNNNIDVENEIDSLYHYYVLSAYYNKSPYDILNRKKIFADFVKPQFSAFGLNRAIIPSDSFVKDILKRVSLLYMSPPVRTINDERANETYQKILKKSNIYSKAKSWHKLLKLHGTVAVRPVPLQRNGEYIINYDILTPDNFRVILDANNYPTKLMYKSMMEVDGRLQDVIIVWTASKHYALDVHGAKIPINETDTNPYNRIPYVFMQLNDEFYSGGEYELIYSNLLYNYYQLLTNEDSFKSSINIFIGKNLGQVLGKNPYLRPGDVINIETDGNESDIDGRFVSSEFYADKLSELGNNVFKNECLRKGIPPSMLSESVQELSGKALRSAYKTLLDEKKDDADIMREHERELAVLTMLISNYHNQALGVPKIDIREINEKFIVDFGEEDFSGDDPKLEFELTMQKVEAGVISIIDVVMRENPDIQSEEDALAYYEKNKAQYNKAKERGFKNIFGNTNTNSNSKVIEGLGNDQ